MIKVHGVVITKKGKRLDLGPTHERRTIRIARHEAAHAVVAVMCGARVSRVEIVDSQNGAVTFDNRKKMSKLAWAIVAAAGTAAEQRWRHISSSMIALGDYGNIRRLGFGRNDWDHLEVLARELVKRHRTKIERVARLLLCRDLTGDDILRVLGRNGATRRPSR